MKKLLLTTVLITALATPAKALDPITLTVIPLLTIKIWESYLGVTQSEDPSKAGYEYKGEIEVRNKDFGGADYNQFIEKRR